MISLRVPGKLYIIGEYSVLKPGNEAILVAVDKFINVTISAAVDYEFSSELGRFKWMLSEKLPVFMYDSLTHAKAAVYVAHMYLNYKKIIPSIYHIHLDSELSSPENKKYGLGSSGAVIIAVIKGILAFHGVYIERLDLFKLAVLAQIEISDVTSGGELAASIYGGWVHYQRYDLIWVMNRKGKFEEVMELNWPLLNISKLDQPAFELAVCYSGLSQSSKDYTDKLQQLSSNPWYATFLNKTHLIVTQFKEALIRSDYYTVKYMIELYRETLLELETYVGIIIESGPFKEMMKIAEDLGFAAKTSGAGYGDCGFSIVRTKDDCAKLHDEWSKVDLMPLKLKVWEHYE